MSLLNIIPQAFRSKISQNIVMSRHDHTSFLTVEGNRALLRALHHGLWQTGSYQHSNPRWRLMSGMFAKPQIVCLEMSSDFKYYFGLVVEEIFELGHAMKS